MLKMRLQRIGRKNSPTYRVVVVDSRQGVKSGLFVDQLGSYEPKGGEIRIDGEKAKEWLAKGVQASPTVHNMLVSKKIIDKPKITVQAPKKEAPAVEEKAEEKKEEVAAEETAEEVKEEAPAEVATEETPVQA